MGLWRDWVLFSRLITILLVGSVRRFTMMYIFTIIAIFGENVHHVFKKAHSFP